MSTTGNIDMSGLMKGIGTAEQAVATKTADINKGGDMKTQDLLAMQQLTSNLANLVSMTSNIQKVLSEMIKSILGNLR